MAGAARSWAVEQPASWALLYGSPVPGYRAPREQTVGPGTRVVGALFDTIADGVAAGEVPGARTTVGQPLASDFDRLRAEFGFSGDDATMIKALSVWAGLIGAIGIEVFGQYGPDTFGDPRAVFGLQVDVLIKMLKY